MTIAALFNRKVLTTKGVAATEGGKTQAEALILESATALLLSKDDAPVALHEVEGGYIVAGARAAVLFADSGDVEAKDLTDVPAKADVSEKFELMRDKKVLTIGTEADVAKWLAESRYLTVAKAMTSGYSLRLVQESKPAARIDYTKDMPGGAILAIQQQVQGAHDRIGHAIRSGALSESQLDEYMQVSPPIPYDTPLKVGGACVGLGSASVYLRNDDFFTKVPHYGVADYLLGIAIADAVKTGKFDAFVEHVQTFLAASPKVKALGVELVESVDESHQMIDESILEEGKALVAYHAGRVVSVSATEDPAGLARLKKAHNKKDDLEVVTAEKAKKIRRMLDKGEVTKEMVAEGQYRKPDVFAKGDVVAWVEEGAHVLGRVQTDAGGDTDVSVQILNVGGTTGATVSLDRALLRMQEGEDITPEQMKKDNVAMAKFHLRMMKLNANFEPDPVKKKAMHKKMREIKAKYLSEEEDDEDLNETDIPDALVLIVSDTAVELRAGDDEGELVASAAYNEDDEDSLADARAEVMSVAEELGYDVSGQGSDDADESVASQIVSAILADQTLMRAPDYEAITEALDRGDEDGALELMSAAPQFKALAEGMASRKHVRGRKPTSKTIPRKAKCKPTAGHPKPPVDVGPGQPKSTSADVDEAWLAKVRTMSVTEFASAMLEAVSKDSLEMFQAKVDTLAEGYASGVGQKDLGRKVTAVNPLIKRRLGRGLSLEEAAKRAPHVESVMVSLPATSLDDILEAARRGGALPDSEVNIVGEDIRLRIPRTLAESLKAEFPLLKLA